MDGAGDVEHCCQEIPADGTQTGVAPFSKIREANIGGSPPVFADQKPAGKAHPRKICLLLDLKYDQLMKKPTVSMHSDIFPRYLRDTGGKIRTGRNGLNQRENILAQFFWEMCIFPLIRRLI